MPAEAAEWVAYCNDPGERRPEGSRARGAARCPALADRQRDLLRQERLRPRDRGAQDRRVRPERCARPIPRFKLIAWGDSGWAARMAEVAGEHVQYLAFHHMFDPDSRSQPVLRGELYRRDPDATWEQLMKAWQINDAKIRSVRESLGARKIPLAMTECHFAIPGRDRGDVLATWAAGVSYARILNNHQRHGDVLKIATAADFCGTRWQNNAVMIPVPKGNNRAYLQPVARVMQLYRHHIGSHAVAGRRRAGRPRCRGQPPRRHRVSPCREHPAHAIGDRHDPDRGLWSSGADACSRSPRTRRWSSRI